MSIILLRHAPLPLKYHGRYNGWSDISIDISLIEEDSISYLHNMKFDIVISSDLRRCTQTLDILKFKYTTDIRLREVEFKDEVEGRNFSELQTLKSYNESFLQDIYSWHNYICKESYISFEIRILKFLDSLDSTKEILICTHAGVITKILSLLDIEYKSLGYLEYINIKDLENGTI